MGNESGKLASKGRPAHRVSLFTATCIVVASMVGTGVFTSLGFQVAEIRSGFALVLIWVLGGFFSLCGALCYAELAALFPRSGGEYHLLSRAFHPFIGFLSGWISITVGFAAPLALAALAFGEYMGNVFPGVLPEVLAAGLVVLVTALHLMRLEVGSVFVNVFTVFKVILIATLAISAFTLGSPQPVRFLPALSDLDLVLSGPFAVALVYVMYSYSGWNATVYIVNEVAEPQSTVPRSLMLGTLVVTILYVALNAAFLYSTPMDQLAGEVEVGLIAGRELFGKTGGNLVAVLIAFGLVSMVSAMTWAGPRVTQMMGEDYVPLRFFARTTRAGIPASSILLQTGIVLVLLLTSTFEFILVVIQLVVTLSSAATVFAVVYLRRRAPGLPRSFRTPGYPVPPICFLVMSLFIMLYVSRERPVETILGLALLAVGAVLHILLSSRRRGPGVRSSRAAGNRPWR